MNRQLRGFVNGVSLALLLIFVCLLAELIEKNSMLPPAPDWEQAEAVDFEGLPANEFPVGSEPRSPEWPRVRREHVRAYPLCAACGGTEALNVHHVEPFHLRPELELDPNNLITLCREHHFRIGHDPDGPEGPRLPNWSAANPNVRQDAARVRQKLNPNGRKD